MSISDGDLLCYSNYDLPCFNLVMREIYNSCSLCIEFNGITLVGGTIGCLLGAEACSNGVVIYQRNKTVP